MRKTIGHKYNIDWDAFTHAVLSGIGSAICVYLNIFAAVHMTDITGACMSALQSPGRLSSRVSIKLYPGGIISYSDRFDACTFL